MIVNEYERDAKVLLYGLPLLGDGSGGGLGMGLFGVFVRSSSCNMTLLTCNTYMYFSGLS